MEIAVSNAQTKIVVTESMNQIVQNVLNHVSEVFGIAPETEVSIMFTDDEKIRQLNLEYREKDMSTDVLSFALNEGEEPELVDELPEILLGDIVISLETAVRQAEEFGHSVDREIAYLLVHGMLHLLGYDHMEEEDRREMRLEEEKILSELGIVRV